MAYFVRCFFLIVITIAILPPTYGESKTAIQHGLRMKGVLTSNHLNRFALGDDFPTATVNDSAGNTYVTGYTEGTLPGQTKLGAEDCFLAKFNSSGVQQWAIQFGTSGSDICQAIALDVSATPFIHVAGYTDGTLPGQTKLGQLDFFVGKFASNTPSQSWLMQFGTPQDDYAYGIACDSSNQAYVVGSTRGSLPGFTNLGNSDAFLMSLTTTGTARWYRQFGSNKDEEGLALAKDNNNRFFPVGYTQGTLPGQTFFGGLDAWVARFTSRGNQNWISQFGTSGSDQAIGVSATSSGITNITGATTGSFPGFTNSGGTDYFLVRKNLNNSQVFAIQDGTSNNEIATASCTDSTGNPYIAGRTTGGFPGFSNLGSSDVWIAKYSTTGTLTWRQQLGTTGEDTLNALSCSTAGVSTAAGSTGGVYPGESALGAEDSVLLRYSTTGTQTWVTQFGTSN